MFATPRHWDDHQKPPRPLLCVHLGVVGGREVPREEEIMEHCDQLSLRPFFSAAHACSERNASMMRPACAAAVNRPALRTKSYCRGSLGSL